MSQDLIAVVDVYAQAYHADKLQHQYGCCKERSAVVAAIQKLQSEIDQLKTQEEAAKEAFGHIVDQKRDAEQKLAQALETIASQQGLIVKMRADLHA